MTSEPILASNPAPSTPTVFADPHTTGRPILALYGCGGTGVTAVRGLERRLGEHPAIEYGFVETDVPSGVPAHRCVRLRPEQLPRTPSPAIEPWLKLTGADIETYRRYATHVSAEGLCQLPFLGFLAAAMQFDALGAALKRDFDVTARRRGGSTSPWLVTMASAMGGTGAPSARVTGMAARTALGSKFRWMHVLVAGSLLADTVQSRRTLALEHQQLRELEALMRSDATLEVPGTHKRLSPPGPDHLLILASSYEAPRTLDECLDELAGVLLNWVD